MLDPAPACELSGALLRRLSWITPNETETQELLKTDIGNGEQRYDAVAERLLACCVKNVLLKLGSRGCLVAQRNLKKQHVPAFTVNAVDTTAAGDAFNGGFAVGLMRGLTVARGAVFASAVAAISVTRPGALPLLSLTAASQCGGWKGQQKLVDGAIHRNAHFAHNRRHVSLIYSPSFVSRVGPDLRTGTNLYHLRGERNLNLDPAFVIHFLELLQLSIPQAT